MNPKISVVVQKIGGLKETAPPPLGGPLSNYEVNTVLYEFNETNINGVVVSKYEQRSILFKLEKEYKVLSIFLIHKYEPGNIDGEYLIGAGSFVQDSWLRNGSSPVELRINDRFGELLKKITPKPRGAFGRVLDKLKEITVDFVAALVKRLLDF